MIKLIDGNIFKREFDMYINTVNCVGVMGTGIALGFKHRYPKMYEEYKWYCNSGNLVPGKIHVWENKDLFKNITIINFPTKKHWRDKSEYKYINNGLSTLFKFLSSKDKVKVAIPALGCGNGGLDWKIVKKMIFTHLQSLALNIFVFPPDNSKRITKYSVKEIINE